MNQRIKGFLKEFNDAAQECEKFCFMSRGKEFQLKSIRKLNMLKENVLKLKGEMINLKDEDAANAALSLENMIETLFSELKMWIALKEDKPNEAWDFLIDAQSAARIALQAHNIAYHLENYINKLDLLEKLLFPPQIFFSPHFIIEGATCSICGEDYEECDHMAGKAYMGKMCGQWVNKMRKAELSIVKEPASKQARVHTFSDSGVTRDFMTWRIINESKEECKK